MEHTVRQEPIVQVLPEVCGLFNLIYPEAGHRLPALRRKYLENPSGQALIWVARGADRSLSACVLAMPWTLMVAGKRQRCMQIGDLMVHPEHRRQGLSLALLGTGMPQLRRQCDAEIAFGFVRTGGASFGGALKFGARLIDRMRSFKRLLLPSYLGKKWLDKESGFERLDRRWLRRHYERASRFRDYTLEPVERLDEAITGVFFEHLGGEGICSLRSAEYLNWRHGGADERRLLLALNKSGKLAGYAALALEGEGAQLADFYPWQQTEAREALFAHLAVHLSARGLKLLHVVAPTSLRPSLRRKQLIARGPGLSLVGYSLHGRERPESFWSRKSWMLTPGDCDAGSF